LFDPDGRALIELAGVRVERAGRSRDALDDWLFRLEWQPAEWKPVGAPAGSSGRKFLVFGGDAGLGDRALSVRAIDETALSGPAGVVYLAGLEGEDAPAPDGHCGAVLEVVQAIVNAGARDAPRLFLVTRGSH